LPNTSGERPSSVVIATDSGIESGRDIETDAMTTQRAGSRAEPIDILSELFPRHHDGLPTHV
jgi:hypothetical protein